ncbi:hypothetical protein ACTGJ9_036400 [Bradyrhizobium sp. RDM12]
MRNRLRVRISAALGIAFLVGVSAQALAACYGPDQQLPATTVDEFLGNSRQLLQDPKNAEGGPSLIRQVRDLVASNPATLPIVIALLSTANSAQQGAIGTGLGQAAGLCIRPDPAFAIDIQTQLAATPSEDAKNAYAAATGSPIRSVAGGGGVSGGASGGSTGGSLQSGASFGTGIALFSSNSTLNSSTNYFTGGTSSASATSFTVFNTATTSVSP